MYYRKAFDLMVIIIGMLRKNHIEDSLVETRKAITQWKQKCLEREIKKSLPELFESEDRFLKALSKEELLYRIEAFCKDALQKENNTQLLTILEKLEILLKSQIELFCYQNEISRSNQYIPGSNTEELPFCLNDNFSEYSLQLLPKCSCRWSHNSRDEIASNSINACLKYCYYIPIEELGKYKVKHIFLTNRLERAMERKVLKIGMTPICNDAKLKNGFFEENGANYFFINGLGNKDRIMNCVLNQLECAKENDIDVFIGPEMLGDNEILETMKGKLEEFNEGKKRYPALTICPTCWENRKNTCVVLDEYGEVIAEQEKLHPFPHTENGNVYIEGIKPNNVINLIHCDGIGRIAILICKDALQREYLHMILKTLKATLVIVPSFSTGSYDFVEITQMCRAYDCCVLWINTCSAVNQGESIVKKLEIKGMFIRTGKAKKGMENKTFEYKECKLEEGSDCKYCIYVSELLF